MAPSDPHCIFCKIVSGDMPAHEVARTESSVTFLDIHPLVRGHSLVIPRAHAQRVADLSDDDRAALFADAASMAVQLQTALGCDALMFGVNDGPAAGQEVPHVHLHLVPRWVGDGGGPIHSAMRRAKRPEDEDLGALAAELAKKVGTSS